jgi:hypothetical protein
MKSDIDFPVRRQQVNSTGVAVSVSFRLCVFLN